MAVIRPSLNRLNVEYNRTDNSDWQSIASIIAQLSSRDALVVCEEMRLQTWMLSALLLHISKRFSSTTIHAPVRLAICLSHSLERLL